MTKEDKELLLKDLCARLPYHPIIQIYKCWEGCKVGEFDNTMGFHHVEAFLCDKIDILPYLRPMSSMTDEEKKEFYEVSGLNCYDGLFTCKKLAKRQSFIGEVLDWLNSHHFDHRGLIEKGLALEAPEGMYKTEE